MFLSAKCAQKHPYRFLDKKIRLLTNFGKKNPRYKGLLYQLVFFTPLFTMRLTIQNREVCDCKSSSLDNNGGH